MESMLAWGLLLLAAALLMIVLEVFIPSAGLISVTAGLLAVGGIVCLFMHDKVWGFAGIVTVLLLGPLILIAGFKIMPATPFGKKLLYGESGRHEPVIPEEALNRLDGLVGVEGEALTDLRPVGTARIEGQRLDVRSEIAFVPAGTKVRVTGVEGSTVRVRPA